MIYSQPGQAAQYPSAAHRELAAVAAGYAQQFDGLDTVLIVNSCARGVAVPASDLDMAILMSAPIEEAAMERDWRALVADDETLAAFRRRGPFSHLHLDFFDGRFAAEVWDEGGGPDDFEIEIGNRVAYAVPHTEPGPAFQALCQHWLPYYDEGLRAERLQMAKAACRYDLEHVPFYLGRGLHLQAFDRLYKAFQEFLQALFIAHRTYPLAYNKWLNEQLQALGESARYAALLDVIAVDDLRTTAVVDKALVLGEYLDQLPD